MIRILNMTQNSAMPLSLAIAKSVESYYRPGMMLWHYEHGLVLYASLKSAAFHKDESVYPWVYSMYDRLIAEDGTIATYREGEFNLDQINAGRALFPLYDKSGEERFIKACDKLRGQLVRQPRTKSGVYWHKEIYPWQIWLDGLYMQGPFNAEYAMRHNDGDELDDNYKKIVKLNNNEHLKNIKSIKYLEEDNYRKILEFIESAPYQIYIMGHSCGNSDRTLLNTLFEHKNCISIKPFYYIKENGESNYLDLIQNISRNFTDMKLMRDRVVNKLFCEPII